MVAQPENKADTKTISTVDKIAFFISRPLSPAGVIGLKLAEYMLALAPNPCLFPGNGGEGWVQRGLLLARADARRFPGKNTRRLFHDQIIPDGFDPLDAACNLACLIDGFLRINEAAQLSDAFAGLYADLK